MFPTAADDPEADGLQQMGMRVLSNVLGSIGFYGGVWGTTHPTEGVHFETPTSIFANVPSRGFFPRGFLWDEGFHQLIVQRWDPSLSWDIVRHWLDRMDDSGWIPREQILGHESVRRVPPEYFAQDPTVANPPTLLFAIESLAAAQPDGNATAAEEVEQTIRGGGDDFDDDFDDDGGNAAVDVDAMVDKSHRFHAQMMAAYPLLEKWYAFLERTQRGQNGAGYRWRGRKGVHVLPSGLDDYPRARNASRSEKHLDLYAWMLM